MKLEGKVALVTGAGRGVGAAIARRFAREGSTVWVSDIDEAAAERIAQEIGQGAHAVRLDVRKEQDWRAAETAIMARSGGLDCLVSNAGITGFEHGADPQDVANVSLADWRAVLATILDGGLLACAAARPER
jgi:NAD(P)-dependent dehydrogenase (short-subunit alcohol dehydrogenase family)